MSRLSNIESEYHLLKLEAEFSAKKADGLVTDEDRALLREAREAFRLHYRLPKEGAEPSPIGVKTKWQRIVEVMRAQ